MADTIADLVGRELVGRHGIDHVFGVVGSGNFHVTNAMVAAGARYVAAAAGADTRCRPTVHIAGFVQRGAGFVRRATGLDRRPGC